MLTLSLAVMVVNTSLRVAANFSNLFEHSCTVTDHAHFASLVVVPTNWNFLKPQAVKLRYIQELDVEAEAVDLHEIKQRSKLRHVECFEAALRIPKRHSGETPHDEIEDLTALLTPPRLMRSDETTVECPRSKREIVLPVSNRIDQLRHFLDRRRQVRIG